MRKSAVVCAYPRPGKSVFRNEKKARYMHCRVCISAVKIWSREKENQIPSLRSVWLLLIIRLSRKLTGHSLPLAFPGSRICPGIFRQSQTFCFITKPASPRNSMQELMEDTSSNEFSLSSWHSKYIWSPTFHPLITLHWICTAASQTKSSMQFD